MAVHARWQGAELTLGGLDCVKSSLRRHLGLFIGRQVCCLSDTDRELTPIRGQGVCVYTQIALARMEY